MPKTQTQTQEVDSYPESHELEGTFLALVDDPTKVVDPGEIARSIVRRIVDAEDFDAALDMADSGALSTADIAETPFVIDEISWHKGSEQFAENSLGVFALMTVTLKADVRRDGRTYFEDGEQLAITTGASNVLATLYKGVTGGKLPDSSLHLRFLPRVTSSGFTTYWLSRA